MLLVTQFPRWHLPAYRKAIATWPRPDEFALREVPMRRRRDDSANLFCLREGVYMDEFRRHFDCVLEEFLRLVQSGASDLQLAEHGFNKKGSFNALTDES